MPAAIFVWRFKGFVLFIKSHLIFTNTKHSTQFSFHISIDLITPKQRVCLSSKDFFSNLEHLLKDAEGQL